MRDLEIEKMQVACTQLLPEDWNSVKQGLRLHAHRPVDICALVLTLTSFLNKTTDTIERTYKKVPVSWFDMFKEQCYPQWLLKYYPINYTDLECKTVHTFLCPHVYFDDQPITHIAFLSQGRDNVKGKNNAQKE